MTFTVWLTGPPASGKTTTARILEKDLVSRGVACEVLDGDEVRRALSPDLGHDAPSRALNVRRLAWLASTLNRHGVAVIVAAVSPDRGPRGEARARVPRFLEVHVAASAATLRARDPKGLYRRAAAGERLHLAGVDFPYEAPAPADLVCDTDREGPEACAGRIAETLTARGWLAP